MAYVDHISVDGVQYDIRDAEAVSFEQEQTLNDVQQEQARANIGAGSEVDVADLKSQKADVDLALGAYPTDTVSGAVASFSDGGDNLPVKNLTINIEPVQSGSGDPSPTNVRPISGWTGANVNANGTSIPITFPAEAGTIYGGTWGVTTGVLTVDKNIITLRGGFYKHPTLENAFYQNNVLNDCAAGKCVSNLFAYTTIAFGYMPFGCFTIDTHYTRVAIRTNDDMTASEFNAMLSSNPLTIVYPLATPKTYQQLTPVEVLTLLGANTIYADTGNTTVTYRADPTLYADKRSTATRSIIAGIEPTMAASKAYTTGQLLIVGDTLYKVAASIASGATLTPGTNVNPTTVAEQLILLANA